MIEKAKDYCSRSATAAMDCIFSISGKQALMPGGRNGPYVDIESPVRNTAHWLVSFSTAHALTGEQKYRDAGEKLLNFLLSNTEFTLGGRYVHRQKHPKDWCNGVIGDAWVAEGLVYAGKLLGREDAFARAQEITANLDFDRLNSAWERHDPIMGRTSIDGTYNHQSWYASVVAETHSDGNIRDRAKSFLDASAQDTFNVEEDGLIVHSLKGALRNRPALWRLVLRKIRDGVARSIDNNAPRHYVGKAVNTHERSVGYHMYVLYSLARLRREFPDHGLWSKDKFLRSLRYAASETFHGALEKNHYTYPYNGPGFEAPLVAMYFGDLEPRLQELSDKAIARQVEKTWCEEAAMFSNGTYDSLTLAARVYELALSLYFRENPAKIS